jgi:hypothetical protein
LTREIAFSFSEWDRSGEGEGPAGTVLWEIAMTAAEQDDVETGRELAVNSAGRDRGKRRRDGAGGEVRKEVLGHGLPVVPVRRL